MLIKHKRLEKIRGSHRVAPLDASEVSRATQLEIHKAKQEARAIRQEAESVLEGSRKKLSEAEAKVKEIIKDANDKAAEIKEKVYRETLELATKEADEMKSQSRQLLEELFEVKREALSQAHNDIIKVALDLTEKIIKYQASIDPNVLKTQVLEAIKRATTETDRVQVFVNPADLETLEKTIPEITKLFPSGIDIVPLSNDSVDQGSCIVETRSGQLDSSFSTQLKSLTSLVSNLEVEPPQIGIKEATSLSVLPKHDELLEEERDLLEEEEKEITQEDVPTQETERLKKELLAEEPLINLIEEEKEFPFAVIDKKEEGQAFQEIIKGDILEIPPEIASKIKEVKTEAKEPAAEIPKRKKLVTETLPLRTKEEAEELDEPDEDLELDIEEEEEELKKEDNETKSVLKPKKLKSSSDVSNIAQDIEKNPEWKDLVQGEDEE